MTETPLLNQDVESFATSRVVAHVFDSILSAVHEGRLQPGERINDSMIAEELGVSRTPVREALQRLREIGIIEASASRFTRIAVVTPRQTADAMVVWLALYGAVISEVISEVPPEMVAEMKAEHERFMTLLAAPDAQKIAEANANFFAHLVTLSRNPALHKGITSVVHQVRLGSLYLSEFIDVRALALSQELLVAAAKDHDLAAAQGALRMISLIEVPLAEPTQGSESNTP